MRRSLSLLLLGFVVVTMCLMVSLPSAVRAQIALPLGDHLACVKIKDTGSPKRSYSVDLLLGGGQFGFPYTGCLVKTPARMACFSAIRTFTNPSIAFSGPTTTNSGFFCYKAKCPKNVVAPLPTGKDPFGPHAGATAAPSGPTMICGPALSPSGAFLDATDL
jgi:hypothetical protein